MALASTWATERALTVDDELSLIQEFEHITLARLLFAQYNVQQQEWQLNDTQQLLARLLAAAEAGDRMGSVIEILLLQALMHEANEENEAAVQSLQRALQLAEPEGYVRLFLNEGKPLANLLVNISVEDEKLNAYINRLLAAFAVVLNMSATSTTESPLLDPLSDRELDVLRLLATDLTGPQIAEALIISLNTMRTHTKNIYSKLRANNRRTAVRRAQELNLI